MTHELKLNALYRHYKTNGLYTPIALVKNTGDGRDDEMMVLYYSFGARGLFTRPLKEFVAEVQGKSRFGLVSNPANATTLD